MPSRLRPPPSGIKRGRESTVDRDRPFIEVRIALVAYDEAGVVVGVRVLLLSPEEGAALPWAFQGVVYSVGGVIQEVVVSVEGYR